MEPIAAHRLGRVLGPLQVAAHQERTADAEPARLSAGHLDVLVVDEAYLSGLPPAFIDCGSAEVFRDEDVAYATSLWRCGIQAELHVWPGGFHAFDLTAPETALAQAMTAARDAWVDRLFAT